MPTLRTVALAALLACPALGGALDAGDPVEDGALPSATGGQVNLLRRGEISVLVFVRPGHGHCLETLRELATREGQLAGVHWLAIVPGDTPVADARALATEAGIRMPVALDPGDAVYGRLRVKLHPTTFVVGRDGRLVASEPFREINYGDRLTARIRFALGEIDERDLLAAEDPARSETHSSAGSARSEIRYAQRLLEMGDADAALAAVQKSLAASPSASGYALQARVLARKGQCKEAARALTAARQLDPRTDAAEAGACHP